MSLALPALLGALGGGPRRLVAPGVLDPAIGFARAQVNTRSTALGPDGAAWQEYLADQPRFHGTARRLLLAGQRTNALRNPRCEGAVAGIVGTLPTNWTETRPAGVSREVIGTGTEDGIQYLEVRYFGTVTAAAAITLRGESLTQVVAAVGESWVSSCFLRLVAGALPPVACTTAISGRTAGGTQTGVSSATVAPTGAPLSSQRVAVARTMADPTTARVSANNFTTATIPVDTVVDFALRLGWPQLEQGSFASLPILPPAGSPQASTRGPEQASASLGALGIGAGGACTLLLSALLPQAAPSGVGQTLLQLDDGGTTARLALDNPAGGSTLRLAAAANTAALGSMTPGTTFRVALAIDGAGRIAASLNGAAAIAATGGPASGLTTLRIGSQAGGANPAFGEFGLVAVLPFATPDAALPALAATLPA